jgi:uncharacterized protein
MDAEDREPAGLSDDNGNPKLAGAASSSWAARITWWVLGLLLGLAGPPLAAIIIFNLLMAAARRGLFGSGEEGWGWVTLLLFFGVFGMAAAAVVAGIIIPIVLLRMARKSTRLAPLKGPAIAGLVFGIAAPLLLLINAPALERYLYAHSNLATAFEDRNVARVRKLIAKDPTLVNQPDKKSGVPPLLVAAEQGDTAMVKALLDLGADPNGKDREGRTPIELAIGNGASVGLLNLLLDHGADPNVLDNEGHTALYYAARTRHHQAIQLLLVRGDTPGMRTFHLQTCLFILAEGSDLETFTIVLDKAQERGFNGWSRPNPAPCGGRKQATGLR